MAEALLPPASRTLRPRVNTSKFMGSSFAAGSTLEERVGNNERKITVLKNILKIKLVPFLLKPPLWQLLKKD